MDVYWWQQQLQILLLGLFSDIITYYSYFQLPVDQVMSSSLVSVSSARIHPILHHHHAISKSLSIRLCCDCKHWSEPREFKQRVSHGASKGNHRWSLTIFLTIFFLYFWHYLFHISDIFIMIFLMEFIFIFLCVARGQQGQSPMIVDNISNIMSHYIFDNFVVVFLTLFLVTFLIEFLTYFLWNLLLYFCVSQGANKGNHRWLLTICPMLCVVTTWLNGFINSWYCH